MAMVCKEVIPATGGWDVKILATDIDSNVLATAQQGIYSAERVQGMSPQRLQRWFRKGQGGHAGLVRVAARTPATYYVPPVKSHARLAHARALRRDLLPERGDLISTRRTQRQLFERFAALLDARGHLFVGHSESLFKVTDRYELLGKTIYRRCL